MTLGCLSPKRFESLLWCNKYWLKVIFMVHIRDFDIFRDKLKHLMRLRCPIFWQPWLSDWRLSGALSAPLILFFARFDCSQLLIKIIPFSGLFIRKYTLILKEKKKKLKIVFYSYISLCWSVKPPSSPPFSLPLANHRVKTPVLSCGSSCCCHNSRMEVRWQCCVVNSHVQGQI